MHTPQILIDTGRSKFWVVENFCGDLLPHLNQLNLLHEPPTPTILPQLSEEELTQRYRILL